jgi:hypothetical protein
LTDTNRQLGTTPENSSKKQKYVPVGLEELQQQMETHSRKTDNYSVNILLKLVLEWNHKWPTQARRYTIQS